MDVKHILIILALVIFFIAGVTGGSDYGPTAPAAPGSVWWRYRGRGFIGWGLFLWALSTIWPIHF
jgi:hypothetical protein